MEAEENAEPTLADFAKRVLGANQNNLDQEFSFKELTEHDDAAVDDKSSTEQMDAPPSPDDHFMVEASSASEATQWQEFGAPEELGDEQTASGRGTRTATEMADIILNALRSVDGVPERGCLVTVYGANPWNAMLTIKPEAGRIKIKDAQLWRTRVQEIGARLRQDFEVSHETQ